MTAARQNPGFDRGLLAYQTIAAFGWDITWKHDKPIPDDAWPIDIINRHIAEAVAAERERCARIAERWKSPRLGITVARNPGLVVDQIITAIRSDEAEP